MGIKRHKPEKIVTKLRRVEMPCGQGMPHIDTTEAIADTGADIQSLA